ncbi:MAG TPA: hypothetical protein VGC87_15385, partial [Pyrinomonadaceae bacterium]
MFSPYLRRRSVAFTLALAVLFNLLPLRAQASQPSALQENPRQPSVRRQQPDGRSPLAQSPILEEFRHWAEQFKLGGTVAAPEQTGLELAQRRREVMAR